MQINARELTVNNKYYTITDSNGIKRKAYVECGGAIETHYKEIDSSLYNEYSKMDYGELSKIVEDGLNDIVKYGYGYYGACLRKDEDGICFLGTKMGRSCD